MGWNLERATATAGDIIADYYLPKVGLNLLSRHLALKDLNRRIDAYCEKRGGVSDEERKRLHEQLGQELKQPRWDVYRFPRIPGLGWRIPFFASLNIGTSWARSWAVAGDTAFGVAYGSLPEEGVLAGWGLAGLWAAAPHLPWTRNLAFIQNSTYSRAMDTVLGTAMNVKTKKTFYDNVQCKNGPPKGGKTTSQESKVAESETDSSADPTSSVADAMMISGYTYWNGVPDPAETGLCSSVESAMKEESLADQVAAFYGRSDADKMGNLNQENFRQSSVEGVKTFPKISPVRVQVTVPSSPLAARPFPGMIPRPAPL